MIKNYIKATLRHLWRNRLFTVLNVVGLAIGISASWTIYRIVDYEYSYDKKITDADRIYQVVSGNQSANGEESTFAGVAMPVVNVLLNDAPGAELVVPMFYKHYNSVIVPAEGPNAQRTFNQEAVQVATLPSYFDLITYQWLAGDKESALDAPGKVVLTEGNARAYFPNLPPDQVIGKTLVYERLTSGDTLYRQVSGVVADLDYPNSFGQHNTEFARVDETDLANDWWMARSSDNLVFFKTAKNANPQHVIEPVNRLNAERGADLFEEHNFKSWYEVLPLSEKHFARASVGAQTRVVSKPVLYGLISIGGFLLLLACINYINLSTALLPQRAREIGIHKTLGGTAKSLIYRFIGETFIITLAALVFSIFLTFFVGKVFATFLPEGMSAYTHYGRMSLFVLVLITVISLLSGLYPAFLSTRVDTVKILKGQTEKAIGQGKLSLRKGLIVFQFLVAQVFVVSAIIVGQQLHYSVHKDLGFDKEAIITVDVPYTVFLRGENKDKEFVLHNELGRIASLRGVSLGDKPMEGGGFTTDYSHRKDTTETRQLVQIKHIDTAYLDVYAMTLLAGRNIRHSDTISELIINEKALAGFGFSSPAEAVGQVLRQSRDSDPYPIVGVVQDFHQYGVQNEISPTLLFQQRDRLHSFNIKLPRETEQWPAAIHAIEKAWNSVYAGATFEFQFYDRFIESLYEKEKNTQTLIVAATATTIFISCLGLFGLATLTTFQRTKEIGIRKVLGASVSGLVTMLSKDFVKLVFIAIIIASPIAWWGMNTWLEDFAYRIDIQWWVFVVAGLLSVVIALLTVSWQAIRAAGANPVGSLRDE